MSKEPLKCFSASALSIIPRFADSSRVRLAADAKFARSLSYRSIASALSLLFMGQLLPAKAQQTTLTAGQDVYTNGLNASKYDLLLGGNVTWRTAFSVNSAARSNIAIAGAGNTITAGTGNRLLSFSQNSNVSITDATITSQVFTSARDGLFKPDISNTTVNL